MCLCHSVRCESSPALPRLEGELSSADAGDVFSQESALQGRRIWILVFSDVQHFFTRAQSLRTTLWFAGACSFPDSCSHFFPLLCVPWGRTWCLVPPSQPFLLGSSFSELVAYWTLFRRSDVATCGCVSLFRRAAFAVLCTSVSKQTCVWSQHIKRICFQF